MGILSGNPQNEPLHYGEVFDIGAIFLCTGVRLQTIKYL